MVARKKNSSSATSKKNQDKTLSDSTVAGKIEKKNAGKADSQNSAASKNNVESVTVILDPVITLAEVAELREKLLGHISAGELKIDASQVEHIDTGGLQLLISLSRALKDQGKHIDWLGWSGACKHTAELLGLKKALEIQDS